jgi:hypothetical protein
MSSNGSDAVDERRPLLIGTIRANVAHQIAVPSDPHPNVVGWDSPTDSENPRNWTTNSKASIVALLTAITILSYRNIHNFINT